MKKIITLILALIMVASMFVACNNDKDPDESKDPVSSSSSPSSDQSQPAGESSSESSSDTPVETDPPTIYDTIGIPNDLNYEDATVYIAAWNSEKPEFQASLDELDGDPVLDAIYKKNLYTEELLGVKLDFTIIPGAGNRTEIISWCETVKNMQGDPASPLDILASYSRTASYGTITGINQDLIPYENLDLDKEWWPKYIQEEYSVGNKLFFVTGDVSTNTLHQMYAVFFNRRMAEQYDLPDLVQMVRDKEWTIDAWIEMTSNMYSDIDDVPGKSPDDIWGVGFQWYHLDTIVMGAGYKLCEGVDGQNGQYIKITDEFYSEDFGVFIDKMNAWIGSDNVWNDEKYIGTSEDAFLSNRQTFQVQRAQFGFRLQSVDVDYGILPPPMLDPERQNYEYTTSLGNPYSIYAISRSSLNGERAAAVLQTLGYYARELTTPAVYEGTFKGKFSQTEEMLEMFDLIRGIIGFDLGILYTGEINYITDYPTWYAMVELKPWSVVMDAATRETMESHLAILNEKLRDVAGD